MSNVPMGVDWYQATDGKWYPRQPPPPAAGHPPPFQPGALPLPGPAPQGAPSKKSRSGLLVGVCACVALGVLVLIAGALAGSPTKENVATKATDGTPTTEARDATPPSTEAPAALPAADAPATSEAPTTEAPTTTATPTTVDPFANETVSQKNARRSAASYLDYSAFSRTGLIKQLEYEGFSPSDAAYAVDAMNADWNAQAAESATQYLEYSSFSHSGLVDQLIYEGFTPTEAEYGVSTTGL